MTDLAVDEMQPYARAFMLAHPGERFVGWRFVTWSCVRPITADDHATFGAWLADRWEAS